MIGYRFYSYYYLYTLLNLDPLIQIFYGIYIDFYIHTIIIGFLILITLLLIICLLKHSLLIKKQENLKI